MVATHLSFFCGRCACYSFKQEKDERKLPREKAKLHDRVMQSLRGSILAIYSYHDDGITARPSVFTGSEL